MQAPVQIGPYRIVRKLGEGGMGAVYEAEQGSSGRRVAIKLLLPHLAAQQEVRSRFLNEATAISLINHPGIIRVFDVGQLPDGGAFLVMELLHGQSLKQRFKDAPRLLGKVAFTLVRDLADALSDAHRRGVIHRDLKPDNVMLVDEPGRPIPRVRILDFGIAKIARDAELGASAWSAAMRSSAATRSSGLEMVSI